VRADKTELRSGTLVVSEQIPGAQSVAVGLYFPTGSRDETPRTNGISHLIEHLVFKGTPTRSADEINREIDWLGGSANAFTSKETLGFHARVLADDLHRVVSLFSDLAAHALPPGVEQETERERTVILSEIAAVEDNPEELVADLCDRAFFGDHPLGLPVVGSAPAVSRLQLPEIRNHLHTHLVARNLVVSAAGRVGHAEIVRLIEEHAADLPPGSSDRRRVPPAPRGSVGVVPRDLEQVQVCLSGTGVARGDPRKPAGELLSAIVGEGCSSRLFREVRERRGLAYTVGSSLASYQDSGNFQVAFGVAPDRLEETLEVVRQVLAGVRSSGVTDEELDTAKRQLRTGVRLSAELTGARMAHLAEQTLLGRDETDVEDLLRSLERVSRSDVNALAADFLDAPLAVGAVGPVRPELFSEVGFEVRS
jgi:predicted Zn-dependent peptidase